jgi:ankyrin repeat protein
LMYAVEMNPSVNITRVLLDAGVDVNAREGMTDWTALIRAVVFNPNLAVVDALLDAGADVTLRAATGERAVDFARSQPRFRNTVTLARLEALSGDVP